MWFLLKISGYNLYKGFSTSKKLKLESKIVDRDKGWLLYASIKYL